MSRSYFLVFLSLLVILLQQIVATPTWYVANDGKSYLIEGDAKYNWLQAYDLCARQDLQLTVIDSAAKNAPFDALLRKVFTNSPNLWLGHHDEFTKAKNSGRPFYTVSTGNKLNYGNWNTGQPDNRDSVEHCVHIWSAADFKWNDADCMGKSFGYVCEKQELTTKYNKDLEQKRLTTNQKNSQVSSYYKDTQTSIQAALKIDHRATNDILAGFDNSLKEIIAESKISIRENLKKESYIVTDIDDIGDIIKEILEDIRKEILMVSEECRQSIKDVQMDTENSIKDVSDRFARMLVANSNEMDKILE